MANGAPAAPAPGLDASSEHTSSGTTAMWGNDTEWALVLPPNRPGPYVLRTIARCLREHGAVQYAGVLGSTPEFLDELHYRGVPHIVCLDRSPQFHEASLTLRRLPQHEQLLTGDWLDTLPDCRGVFDIVLSDFTLGNLSYTDQEEFLRVVARSLRPGGLFVDRVLTYRRPCYSYRTLYYRFRALPANLTTLNNFNAQWLFCGERVGEHELVDTSETYEWSTARFGSTEIGWLIRNCQRITPSGLHWFYGRPWHFISAAYERCFNLQAEISEPRSSAYCGFVFLRVSSPTGALRPHRVSAGR